MSYPIANILEELGRIGVSVIATLGIGGVVVALLKEWLLERLKSRIQHENSMQLERERARLIAENDRTIQTLRGELEKRLAIHAAATGAMSAMASASSPR